MGTPAHTQRGLGRREALLDAACTLIARSGTRTLRIEDVAREAGVSIGLVYYYFESREELLEIGVRARQPAHRRRVRAAGATAGTGSNAWSRGCCARSRTTPSPTNRG